MNNTNQVDICHLRVIMRALDIDMSDKDLEATRKMIDPLNEGFIKYANLKLVMEDKLKEVDTYDDLIVMFQRLDKDGDGFIPTPEFKQYMRNLGIKMT